MYSALSTHTEKIINDNQTINRCNTPIMFHIEQMFSFYIQNKKIKKKQQQQIHGEIQSYFT